MLYGDACEDTYFEPRPESFSYDRTAQEKTIGLPEAKVKSAGGDQEVSRASSKV